MKIEDIMKEVEKHMVIDETNLSRESLETSKIYGKILRIRTEESIRHSGLKTLLKTLYKQKRDYYDGKADPEVYRLKPFNRKLAKVELDGYIEADPEISELITKIDIQSEKITYLNDALKMISNRNFQIKSAIDYQKLINGGY